MIVPSVLEYDVPSFNRSFSRMIKLAKRIQIDLMDGKFVPERSVPLLEIPWLGDFPNLFEAHLMVEKPESYAQKLKNKGFKAAFFHYEATKKNYELVRDMYDAQGIEVGIAFRPGTKTDEMLTVVPKFSRVLFVCVEPGGQGRPFVDEMLKSIREVHAKFPKLILHADGHVDVNTLQRLAKAGVSVFTVGRFLTRSEDPKAALDSLKKAETLK